MSIAVHNKALSILKNNSKYIQEPIDDELITTKYNPEGSTLSACMDALPDVYKNTLILHYDMGYTVREIARMENVTEEAINVRIHRSRKMLKDILELRDKEE